MADPMELFRLYKDDIYRFALSYTHSREDAEDICQSVFEQLLRHPSIQPGKETMQPELLDKHYLRKHGANAYYGQ